MLGVFTATGIKKSKVSMPFVLETLIVTIVFVIIRRNIGAGSINSGRELLKMADLVYETKRDKKGNERK